MALFNRISSIKTNRLEILKKSDVRIPQGKTVDNKGKRSPFLRRREKTENQNTSLFEEDLEISRRKLSEKLKTDDAYNLSRESGLNLNSAERDRIEKELLPKSYGGSISKSEFKSALNKLNKERIETEDFKLKEKLKKEIKFFKKLEGD